MPPPAQTQPIWQYSASQQVQYYLDTARNEYVFRDGRRIPISAIPVPRTIPSEPVSIRAAQAQVRQSASTAPASTSMSVRYSTGRAVTEQSDDEDSDNDDSDEAPESEKERPDIPTAYDPQRKAHDRRTTSSKAQPSLPLRSKHQGQPSTQSQTATSVRCLMLWWADDNLDCGSDVRNLANVLSSSFGYAIQARQIPSGDSYRNLRDRVATFINDARSANELFIVFYSGHGSAGDPNDPKANRAGLEWSATERSNSPSLPWTPIQNELLMKATQDVLLILDCCYAGSALKSPATNSRKELLAACGWESETISGSTSYTANLIRHLRSMSGAFEACDLHSRLATSHATRKALRYTPLWTGLGGNSRRHVVLTPLD
ncbi:hypothetical protein LTR56_020537 [Elasticomyces elasticus]|nr:hypothetical protein LTR56_020537 [Elasticomyces elasticus]KAK4905296.1 hypothetical protein LTR49_025404 [Elasticomyces elasticus]KAK5742322.1 hypothetical protein LTS12_024285 [Elasticomyces elasticus]